MSTKLETANGTPRVFTKTSNEVSGFIDTSEFLDIIDTMDIQRYHGAHSFTWVEKVKGGSHKIVMRAMFGFIIVGGQNPSGLKGPKIHKNIGGASLSYVSQFPRGLGQFLSSISADLDGNPFLLRRPR